MPLRLIQRVTARDGSAYARVCRDTEWLTYTVKLYRYCPDGPVSEYSYQPNADYDTEDFADAVATANKMVGN